ncbi:MAG: cyanophycinase [Bryobacteraceae bacterium]|nr:cyanophycinase [Bryobacteraceae bacterium]MDW8378407.1 cyanophycinase [Bryobacterales bacterium]
MRVRFFQPAALTTAFLALLVSRASAQSSWESAIHGNPEDVVTPVQAGYVLMGGGRDVDEAIQWLIQRAGRGDVVVLRASGTAAYNPYMVSLGADSAETIIFRDREASSDPLVLQKIRLAEAIWIAGGDQWNYIRLWKDTPLQQALQEHIDAGRPLGGTSAGLAVLGEFFFSARHDSVRSEEAGLDPYHPRVTVETGFLRIPNLQKLITDSHFSERDRMVRTLAFLARIQKDFDVISVRAVGLDEQTAIVVDGEGAARVVGRNRASLLRTTRLAEQCEPARPLRLDDVEFWSLGPGDEFRLNATDFGPQAPPKRLAVDGLQVLITEP